MSRPRPPSYLEATKAATVMVSGLSVGTGFFFGPRRLLTCVHVSGPAGAEAIVALQQNQASVQAKVVTHLNNRGRPIPNLREDYPDLAILEITGHTDCPYIELDPTTSFEVGESFYSFGFPDEGGSRIITPLLLTYAGTKGPTNTPYMDLKHDVVATGCSGGPLFRVATETVCGFIVAGRSDTAPTGGLAVSWGEVVRDLEDIGQRAIVLESGNEADTTKTDGYRQKSTNRRPPATATSLDRQRSEVAAYVLDYEDRDRRVATSDAQELMKRLAADSPLVRARYYSHRANPGEWRSETRIEATTNQVLCVIGPPSLVIERNGPHEIRFARSLGIPVLTATRRDFATFSPPTLSEWGSTNFDIDNGWGDFVQAIESATLTKRVPFLAPPLPESYVARPEFTELVMDALTGEARREPNHIVSIHGFGGMGKTVLATQLAHDSTIRRHYPDGVLWLNVGEGKRVSEINVSELLEALTGRNPVSFQASEIQQLFAAELRTRRALLVLDDVWHPDQLDWIFEQGPIDSTAVVVTSRTLAPFEHNRFSADLAISPFSQSEAIEILSKQTGEERLGRDLLQEIADQLAGNPLLLNVARAQLDDLTGAGGADVQDAARAWLAGFTPSLQDPQSPDVPRRLTVESVLAFSIRGLGDETRDRFESLAVFEPDSAIPIDLLPVYWGTSDSAALETLDQLDDSGLLQIDDRTIAIHDVVHDHLRATCDQSVWRTRLIKLWTSLDSPQANTRFAFGALGTQLNHAKRWQDLFSLADPSWRIAKLRVLKSDSAHLEDLRLGFVAAVSQGLTKQALQIALTYGGVVGSRSGMPSDIVGMLIASDGIHALDASPSTAQPLEKAQALLAAGEMAPQEAQPFVRAAAAQAEFIGEFAPKINVLATASRLLAKHDAYMAKDLVEQSEGLIDQLLTGGGFSSVSLQRLEICRARAALSDFDSALSALGQVLHPDTMRVAYRHILNEVCDQSNVNQIQVALNALHNVPGPSSDLVRDAVALLCLNGRRDAAGELLERTRLSGKATDGLARTGILDTRPDTALGYLTHTHPERKAHRLAEVALATLEQGPTNVCFEATAAARELLNAGTAIGHQDAGSIRRNLGLDETPLAPKPDLLYPDDPPMALLDLQMAVVEGDITKVGHLVSPPLALSHGDDRRFAVVRTLCQSRQTRQMLPNYIDSEDLDAVALCFGEYLRSGHTDVADELLQAGLEVALRLPGDMYMDLSLAHIADALWRAGFQPFSRDLVDSLGELRARIVGMSMLAESAYSNGQMDEATEFLSQAEQAVTITSIWNEIPRGLISLSRAYSRTGNLDGVYRVVELISRDSDSTSEEQGHALREAARSFAAASRTEDALSLIPSLGSGCRGQALANVASELYRRNDLEASRIAGLATAAKDGNADRHQAALVEMMASRGDYDQALATARAIPSRYYRVMAFVTTRETVVGSQTASINFDDLLERILKELAGARRETQTAYSARPLNGMFHAAARSLDGLDEFQRLVEVAMSKGQGAVVASMAGYARQLGRRNPDLLLEWPEIVRAAGP